MNRKEITRDLVAQFIPTLLLGFYVFAIGTAIWSTVLASRQCGTNAACAVSFHAKRIEGVNVILNLVGGLVSALVIAELAITQPGKLPSAQLMKKRESKSAQQLATILSTAFVLVWLICGTASVLVYILYPNALPASLSEFAKAWLGLALASTYSYLGIR